MTIRTILTGFAIVVVVLLAAVGNGIAASAPTASTESAAPTAVDEAPALDGAKVYAWSCGSCHSERRPKERSDSEWEVITTHMRVRANLTAAQSAAVLDYLKENN